MRRLSGIAALTLVLVLGLALGAGTGRAWAQEKKFGELATAAVAVDGPGGLASILWSWIGSCEKAADTMARRQCEGLKRARQAQLAGKSFLVEADAAAFAAGDYDDKRKSLPVTVVSCIVCTAPVPVDGQTLFVVGDGAPAVEGKSVRGGTLHAVARPFVDAEGAARWKSDVVPRLRTQLVVRVPDATKTWSRGELAGVSLQVVGYRVYDPCDGSVVSANPASEPIPANKKACGAEAAEPAPAEAPVEQPVVAAKPKLPSRLSSAQIQQAMRPAADAAEECYANYGVAGSATFRVTFDAKGDVIGVEQDGDFVDTPTGTCVSKAVKAVKFPPTSKAKTTVTYPFILR